VHGLLATLLLSAIGCDMELVTRRSERPGHQQRLLQMFTERVFIFSLFA